MFFALPVEGEWGMECGVVLKNASLIEVSRHHLQSFLFSSSSTQNTM